jgi:hypothetical protein
MGMAARLIEIYDQLLELYELRNEAERRADTGTIKAVQEEIRSLECAAADIRARRRFDSLTAAIKRPAQRSGFKPRAPRGRRSGLAVLPCYGVVVQTLTVFIAVSASVRVL